MRVGPFPVAHYDPVGNRTQQTSTVPAISSGSFGYDADDRLSADVYDPNGNTVNSGGIANVYDFENHLVQQGGATMVYDAPFASRRGSRDGNGNRVAKTVAGITTKFLISDISPTGYAQVVSENFSGGTGNREEFHTYVYGLDRISQTRIAFFNNQNITQTSYYVYDGHGSVRALTDPTGNVTDTYDYDAFGNEIHSSTTQSSPTFNEFLFAGEQFDSDLHLYYNRARYLNVATGRFWTMDTPREALSDPGTLHRYLYVRDDPANRLDPSGNQDELDEELEGAAQLEGLGAKAAAEAIETGEQAAEGLSEVQDVTEAEQLQVEAEQELEQATQDEAQQLSKNATKKVGKLSRLLGHSQEEIRDAIHELKRALPRGGPIRNPDLVIDPDTGEAYPELPGGGIGDPIGNIFDHLPDDVEE